MRDVIWLKMSHANANYLRHFRQRGRSYHRDGSRPCVPRIHRRYSVSCVRRKYGGRVQRGWHWVLSQLQGRSATRHETSGHRQSAAVVATVLRRTKRYDVYWREWHSYDDDGTLHMKISGWRADDVRWSGALECPRDHRDYDFWQWILNESGCKKTSSAILIWTYFELNTRTPNNHRMQVRTGNDLKING